MAELSSTKLLHTHHVYSYVSFHLPLRAAQGISLVKKLPSSGLRVLCCERPATTTTKVGRIGQDRFKEGALPGTYWNPKPDSELGEEVLLTFNKDSKKVTTSARPGENLLWLAEKCGVMMTNTSFCFEGSCCHCEMEVLGGAQEAGNQDSSDLVRSCLCPVPSGRNSIEVNLFDDDGW